NANVIGKSSNKKISEMQLVQNQSWKKKLINSIDLNYRGSEYFTEVFPVIEQLIQGKQELLFEYNCTIIKGICEFLNINTTIVTKNENYLSLELELDKISETNYSSSPELLLTKPIKKVARVLKICKAENASVFINAIGGKELYNKEEFKSYGIELLFVESKPYQYKQFSKEFISGLSIIDVLMHNGKRGTNELLNNYNLV
ncbi:MAG: WbqC family protein, partial [Bacteroidota bacterium]